jgi:hypothetical protein
MWDLRQTEDGKRAEESAKISLLTIRTVVGQLASLTRPHGILRTPIARFMA